MKQQNMTSGFAIPVEVLLVVDGIWELFSPVVFRVLTSNKLHGAIHGFASLAVTFPTRRIAQ
jgi:hypothetical protein